MDPTLYVCLRCEEQFHATPHEDDDECPKCGSILVLPVNDSDTDLDARQHGDEK